MFARNYHIDALWYFVLGLFKKKKKFGGGGVGKQGSSVNNGVYSRLYVALYNKEIL